jgi:hypothetical protein
MKQYDEVCGFPIKTMEKTVTMPQKSIEAILDRYYDRSARISRTNLTAKQWYEHQIDNYGCPWLYHCGGVK